MVMLNEIELSVVCSHFCSAIMAWQVEEGVDFCPPEKTSIRRR